MTDPTQSLRYRPEIDGLRAVAVLAVVAYHGGLGVPGGYVGVDVFLVISGYLITSLIVKELEHGSFSLPSFWERRARRILPALVVMTLCTLITGYVLLLPKEYVSLGKAVAAQAVFAANIYYWRDTGYFAGGVEEKALLHTWSLAVEEQFYFLLPLLLALPFRGAIWRDRQRLVHGALIAATLSSLALSIYAVSTHPSAAFYFLPTRAWELLLGAALSVFAPRWPPCQRMIRECATLFAFGAIVVPCFAYTKDTPFPGLRAIPPCVGTALLLWAITDKVEGASQSFLGWLLSTPAMVFVGVLSYSLYLWHWPVLSFSAYWASGPLSLRLRLLLVALGFFLAFLSWRFVETPFRARRVVASGKGMLVFAGIALVAVALSGTSVVALNGFPHRFSPEVLAYARGADDSAFVVDLSLHDVERERLSPIGIRDLAAPVRVVVWGDSFAMAAMPAFDSLLKERGVAGRAATHSLTAPVLGFFKKRKFGLGADSLRFNRAVLSFIEAHHPSDVFLVGQWSSYAGSSDTPDSISLDSALLATVRQVVRAGARPWVLLQVPTQSFDVPRALARAAILGEDIEGKSARPSPWNGLSGEGPEILRLVEGVGGHVLDPRPWFLDPTGHHYIVQKEGRPLYRDSGHLTTEGAYIVLLPFLREAFQEQSGPLAMIPGSFP